MKRSHQLRRLHRVHEFGAVAGLLVVVGGERGWWVWPCDAWAMPTGDSSWSVKLNDNTPLSVAMPVPGWDGAMFEYVPDWHAAVCKGETDEADDL